MTLHVVGLHVSGGFAGFGECGTGDTVPDCTLVDIIWVLMRVESVILGERRRLVLVRCNGHVIEMSNVLKSGML